jgi:glycosyltransferase involved in cell wall biosynthesis
MACAAPGATALSPADSSSRAGLVERPPTDIGKAKRVVHAAFVLPRFYPYRGGYENSMLAIGRCLAHRGHRVSVFTTTADDLEALWAPGYKTFPPGELEADGVRVRRFSICYRKWRRRTTRLAGLMPNWRLRSQFWTPGFRVPGLDAALRECDADVFHIGPLPYNSLMYAGLRAAERSRVPLVCTPCLHLGEPGNDVVVRHYLQPHQLELLRHCDRVLCMTEVEQEYLKRKGVRRGSLTTTGLGIDMQQVQGGDGDGVRQKYGIAGPVVLHLGVKAYEKGSITLVKAMQSLWAKGATAWLVMAGPSMSEFEAFAGSETRGLPRFLNLPAFADEDKRELLAAATIVAQPSRVESLGLIMLEACANGKPVVAADIKVSRKLLAEPGAGVVTRFGDPVDLATQIEKLLSNPDLCHAMGVKGQQVSRSFDGSILWPRNADVIEQSCSHAGK